MAGFEAVGDVVAVGEAVVSPELGARVAGVGSGAFAETVLTHAAAGATGQAAVKLAKHFGARVIASASPSKHEAARALGADHVLDSRSANLAAAVLELTSGAGADLVLECAGGATFQASLAAAKRVTGRVVVYGLAGGDSAITNRDLVYEHQVQIIGLNIGVLIQATPQLFGELMRDMHSLVAVRSWLYQITTNVCLTWLKARRPRVLPSGLSGAYDGPGRAPDQVASSEVSWLEPLPDAWIASSGDDPAPGDPAAALIARESLRLALVASLQYLPASQRACFILREVLAFSAAETAEIFGTTPIAVKSALQRARARLDELRLEPEPLLEPTDPRARELLDGYIAAFERSDPTLLVETLRADATLEATPFVDWRAGRVMCIHLLATYILGERGDWRMIATAANGQPAAAVYRRDTGGVLRANGIVVLATTESGVSRVIAFHHEPALVAVFGFAPVLAEQASS